MDLYEHINGFFNPKSVAVIGASSKPGKIGYAVLDNLRRYHGKVFPINPRKDEILGLKSYPSIEDVPETIDMAVIVIRSEDVPQTIEKCAKKGVKNIVIISGGFKEIGGKYRNIEEEIAEMARKYNIRIVGPNCIGVFDPRTGLDTFFQPRHRMLRPGPGNVAFLSQSGTYGIILLEWAAMDHLGVSKFVSYGNKVDVDEADLLLYLLEEPNTEVIGIYMEGLKDGKKFYDAAKKVSKVKPVVILRGGWSEQARMAVMSHTGFLGGSGRIYWGAFKQAGLYIAKNLEDLYDMVKALAKQTFARGNRVAMVSNGAGPMVQAIDAMVLEGLELAKLSEETIKRFKEELSPFTVVNNPVDVTGSATTEDYKIVIDSLIDDPNVDMIFVFFVHSDSPLTPDIVDVLGELSKKAKELNKPILIGAAGGPYTLKLNEKAEKLGIPTYPIPERLVSAAKALYLEGIKKGT